MPYNPLNLIYQTQQYITDISHVLTQQFKYNYCYMCDHWIGYCFLDDNKNKE